MQESNGGITEEEGDRPVHTFASDGFYRALAEQSRRRILFSLLEDEQSTAEDLAELLYGWATTSGEQVTYDQIRLELYHSHLPKLAASGLVEFDPETGAVERAELAEEIRAVIRHSIAAEQHDRPADS